MPLTGSLEEINVGALIQTLSMDGKRGTLRITDERTDRYFYLDKQEIALFVPSIEGPIRIGELLVRAAKITEQQLADALERRRGTDKMLGKILVEMGACTEDDIDSVIRTKFHEEFFEICLVRNGSFEFLFDTHPEDIIGSDGMFNRVSMNTSNLIMEALRQIDEWGEMRKAIPTGKAIFIRQIGNDDQVEGIDLPADVKRGVQMIDGRLTVDDLLRVYDDSKFRLYTLLHELLSREVIRPLSVEELKELALESELHSNWMQAARYYEYAIFQEPRNIWIRKRFYNLLKETGRDLAAAEEAIQIGECYLEDGEVDPALSFFQVATNVDDRNVRALQGIFRCYQKQAESGDAAVQGRARAVGEVLIQEMIRAGRFREAEKVLDPLQEGQPENPRYARFQAEIFDGLHEKEDAIRAYERAANLLSGDVKRRKELIEVLRRIVELDPSRQDARQQLAIAEAAEEIARRRRRKNRIAVGILAAAVLTLLLAGAAVEIPARFAVARAETAEASGDLVAAQALYRIAASYELSSVATDARTRADALGQRIAEAGVGTIPIEMPELPDVRPPIGEPPTPGEPHDVAVRPPPATPFGEAAFDVAQRPAGESMGPRDSEGPASAGTRAAQEAAAEEMLAEAAERERQGDIDSARRAILAMREAYPRAQVTQRARIPVLVRSIPAGARVTVARNAADDSPEYAGETPAVCRIWPYGEWVVRVEAPGFVSAEQTISAIDTARLTVDLVRPKVWEAYLPAAPVYRPLPVGERVVVLAGDGTLFGLGGQSGDVMWRVPMGDGASPPCLVGPLVFIVRANGRALALDPLTGEVRWSSDLGVSVRSEATFDANGNGPGLVGVRGEDGVIRFLAANNGQGVWRFDRGGGAAPGLLSLGPRTYVPGADHRLYLVDRDLLDIVWWFDARAAITAAPVSARNGAIVILGTESGEVCALDAERGELAWRARVAGAVRGPLLVTPDVCVVADGSGAVSCLSVASGALRWSFAARSAVRGISTDGQIVYLGTDGGEIIAIDGTRAAIVWRQSLGVPIACPPALGEGRIYVALTNGRIAAFER